MGWGVSCLSKKTPPPRGGFLFTMFPNQEPGGRGSPSKHLVHFFRGSPLPLGSWLGNIVNGKTPPEGGFFRSKCSRSSHVSRLGTFTHEIALNDEYLSQFSPDLKVLYMTLKQLFKIFIKLTIFDCNRAIRVLLRGQDQLLVPSEWGKARKPSKIPQESFPQSQRIDQKRSQKLSKSYNKNMPSFFLKKNFLVELFFRNIHLTVKSHGTSLMWFLFCCGSYFAVD